MSSYNTGNIILLPHHRYYLYNRLKMQLSGCVQIILAVLGKRLKIISVWWWCVDSLKVMSSVLSYSGPGLPGITSTLHVVSQPVRDFYRIQRTIFFFCVVKTLDHGVLQKNFIYFWERFGFLFLSIIFLDVN